MSKSIEIKIFHSQTLNDLLYEMRIKKNPEVKNLHLK